MPDLYQLPSRRIRGPASHDFDYDALELESTNSEITIALPEASAATVNAAGELDCNEQLGFEANKTMKNFNRRVWSRRVCLPPVSNQN